MHSNNKITRSQFLGTSIGLATIPSLGFGGSTLGEMMKSPDNSFRMTEQMKTAYEVRLKILKPTKAQLEHGLELHRKSVVFDTYRFMPTAAVDGAVIAEAINNNASALELKDMREDMTQTRFVDTGGYIGICCIPCFLGGSGDISAMMKHIDYVVKKFGVDHVTIRSDVRYNSQYSVEENKIISKLATKPASATRIRFAALWPEEPFNTTSEMSQSMAWTNWPLFTVGLVQMGYSDYDIQKIIGGNALRVAKAALN